MKSVLKSKILAGGFSVAVALGVFSTAAFAVDPPICVEAGNGNWAEVQRLVEAGANVDSVDECLYTALNWAIQQRNLNMVRFLVEHGADVNHKDRFGQTPLLHASFPGDFKIMRLLIEHGASCKGKSYEMLLCSASAAGDVKEVKDLIDQGVDVNSTNDKGWTPLRCAFYHHQSEVARLLIDHGAICDDSTAASLFLISAAANGDLKKVKDLIERGTYVDCKGEEDITPLCMAVHRGRLEVVRYLVEHGADVNDDDGYEYTPLLTAADCGCLEIAQYLVEHGANVNHPSAMSGTTPLCRAAGTGHFDIARYLVEHGADVNFADNEGNTPLSEAKQYVYVNDLNDDIVHFLVDHGAK